MYTLQTQFRGSLQIIILSHLLGLLYGAEGEHIGSVRFGDGFFWLYIVPYLHKYISFSDAQTIINMPLTQDHLDYCNSTQNLNRLQLMIQNTAAWVLTRTYL